MLQIDQHFCPFLKPGIKLITELHVREKTGVYAEEKNCCVIQRKTVANTRTIHLQLA